ncbi:MAG: M48 family metallopeptidase [Verrucomicrobia bacterium]|nr:M48 family metallopeptidase [Kiritimatiellia bacterium]MCP5487984.1 M48 family metallopeptidase [Verrucomicrobiota bacterium]
MNGYLLLIIVVLVGDAALHWVVDRLNLKHLSATLPEAFRGWYDEAKYAESQRYLRASTSFETIQSLFSLVVTLLFLLAGGFGWLQGLAASAGYGMILTGVMYMAILMLGLALIGLPFSVYDTFVLEDKFGFNKTTPGTFAADQVKSLILSMAIGLPLLAGLLWFFSTFPQWGWLITLGVFLLVQFFLMLIAPSVLLPLFNKFTPLADGELKTAIEAYARQQNYKLSGIFAIDGSRRSTKSNAYVTGFGSLKRIALFDTLIEKHTTDELVSVLAHEVGHAKLGHIRKMLFASALSSAVMFFLLSLFLQKPGLYQAMGIDWQGEGDAPLYVGLIGFFMIMSPLQRLMGIGISALSRKHEYEADAFAIRSTGSAGPLMSALKKLSVDNLSNLTPHPAKVWLEYSHPPMPDRLAAMEKVGANLG